MCGIAGIYNPKGKNVTRLVKILLAMNESRGAHASGLYGAREGIVKKAIAAREFIQCKELKRSMNSPIYLLHTRFATHGVNNDQNAHPFDYMDTIMTHNGVLYGYEWVKDAYHYSHAVDSANLLPILQSKRWAELKNVGGAMTLAWTYKDSKKLFLHKRTNPLHLVKIDNIIFYSSEAGPLELLKLMFNSKSIINTITSDRVISIAPDFKFKIESKDTTAVVSQSIAYQNWDEYDFTSTTQVSTTGYKRQSQWLTSNQNWKAKNRQKLQNSRVTPVTPEPQAPEVSKGLPYPFGYKNPEPSPTAAPIAPEQSSARVTTQQPPSSYNVEHSLNDYIIEKWKV